MTQTNYKQISKYARHFFSGTLLSRISGMLRDVGMAAAFGDHPSVAAFMVAFRFSHLLRRLLGEGALQSIFIPHYEGLRLKNENQANAFFFRLNILLITALIVIILLVESIAGFKLYNTSFASNEVLSLFAWMFPSLIFITLYGLNLSLLQCRNSFFSSSIAPFACNLIWICAIFIFAKEEPSKAMVHLALFTLIGFIVQWLITLPQTWKILVEGMRSFSPPFFSIPTEIRTIGKATLFGLIGVTAVQINSFLDMLFARYADLKAPVYLWYAIRLEQLPLALIGFACVYSIVPSLSRLIKADALDKAQDLFLFGYKRIFLLIIPCTFALFALSFVSVNLLFGRGNFSQMAVIETTFCLWAYGLSLLSSTLTIYLSSVFYAYENFRTPTIASLISIAANISLNALFVFFFHWGAISIALSTSLSAFLNCWILKSHFSKKGYLKTECLSSFSFWKLGVVGAVAFFSSIFIDKLFFNAFFFQKELFVSPRTFSTQSLCFLGYLISFSALFTLGLFLIDKKTFTALKNNLLPRKSEPSQNETTIN